MSHNDPLGGRNGLRRSRTDRVLGGVCAGMADQLDLDTLLVRVVAVAFALVSGGAAVVAYLIAWVVIPNSTGRQPSTAVVAGVDAVAIRVRRDSPPGLDNERPIPSRVDVADEVPSLWPTS